MKDRNRNSGMDKENIKREYIKNILLVFACILLSIQTVSADQIFVSTNRYVVLDDPNTGTASAGFPNMPSGRNWGSAYWSGEPTTIRAVALVTDDAGSPRSGVTVTFSIRNPGNTQVGTSTNNTNLNGIAYYSLDLNEQKYWGNWTIEASITGVTNTTPFILNWWGCANCHGSKSLSTTTHTPKSYYVKGYNFHNDNLAGKHNDTMSAGSCTQCHRTYDYKQDWHTGKVSCAGCHINSTMQGRNPEIAGCYDTEGCHAKKNTNLEEINTTTGYVVGGNYRTKYSFIPNDATKAHRSGSVECIACHDAGHNIKKPYNLAGSSNGATESEQCWSCHTDRTSTHMNNNNCVMCHSQNAHNVSIGGGGGGGIEPGNYTGSSSNCKGCHPSQYNKWANSTHTSKLITREDAMARGYPNPPGGYSWNNVSFVIGSKWKIRYVNDTGYIITAGGKNQYNVDDQIWTDYNKDLSKKYNCGHCHATGYLDNVLDINKEPFKTLRSQGKIPDGVYDNSLTPGFVGYWAENSIGCEACHGQGGDHINSPSKLNIRNASVVRNSPEICGDCHSRPRGSKYGEYDNFKNYPYGVNDSLLNESLYDDSPMPTVNYSLVGGHHEQWEDWKASGHNSAGVSCVLCHGGHGVSDPAYAGGPTGKTKFTNGTVYPAAVNRSCINCHIAELPKHGLYNSNSECIVCHMPINRKSSNKIDLRSHWFDINALKNNKNGNIHDTNFDNLTGITDSCIYCHNSSVNNRQVNIDKIGMHKDLDKTDGIGRVSNKDCLGCHFGPHVAQQAEKNALCVSCHNRSIPQDIGGPKVDEHVSNGLDVKVLEHCSLCHNNSINQFKGTRNASVSHYGTIDLLINTSNCILCHNGPYTGDPNWGTPVDISTSTKRIHTETLTSECDNCHKDSSVPTLLDVNFHNASIRLGVGQGDNCLDCHASAG